MKKSTVKDDVLDRAVSGAPAEKVPFGGDKKEQTTRAQSRMSQQRSKSGQGLKQSSSPHPLSPYFRAFSYTFLHV